MIAKDLGYFITITFQSDDWDSGLARDMISKIKKEIPHKDRSYDKMNKLWKIKNKRPYIDSLTELKKQYDFKSEDWLDATFGKDRSNKGEDKA